MAAIVILPGLDGTGTLLDGFCGVLGALGVQASTVAYPLDRPVDYGELEPLVRAQLPTAGSFILLGESFSGPLAIRIAADPPPGLAGLVLSTTFARTPVRGVSPLAPLARYAPARWPMVLLSWLLLGRWASPRVQEQLGVALRSVKPAVLRARAAAALGVDVSGLLGSVSVPVLQLVASDDRLLARSASVRIAAHLPACKTVEITGPHLLLQAATHPSAETVARFALDVLSGKNTGLDAHPRPASV